MLSEFDVLDHGYVRFIESWGSDQRIIEAARMSTDKGFLGWDPGVCPVCEGKCKYEGAACYGCDGKGRHKGDMNLMRYLYSNRHDSPFEFAGLVIEVQAPIFVFREWHRHRTQSYNEMSARYIQLPNLAYIPSVERLLLNSKTNKQAGTIKGADELTEDAAIEFRKSLRQQYDDDEQFYNWGLKMGVPKELARVGLPVGRYSRMRAQATLRNWIAFCTLREAPNAQWEIRQYANIVHQHLANSFPRVMGLFEARQTDAVSRKVMAQSLRDKIGNGESILTEDEMSIIASLLEAA